MSVEEHDLARSVIRASTHWSAQIMREVSVSPGDALQIARGLLTEYSITPKEETT